MGKSGAGVFKSEISFKASTEALSPILGSLFLLLLCFGLVAAAATGVFGICGSNLPGKLAPVGASIEIELAEGGFSSFGSNDKRASFDENCLILVHAGGTPLALESTSILISGHGNAYSGSVKEGGQALRGELLVSYFDLTSKGKNKIYRTKNQQVLDDGLWTAGERLILNGRNSPKKGEYTSVHVKVDEIEATSNNYAFKAGAEITVTLVDTESRVRLAQEKAIIKTLNEK
ncbi:MAG: type IV pilin [Methanosarcinaceae archaeon]|nr:type IV pilin [Methanosarcinaceae archaeon]